MDAKVRLGPIQKIGGLYDRQVINIDIDLDGINDFEISGYVWGSTGMGHYPEADIACLNTATFLNLTSTIDTTFFNRDTNIYTQNGQVNIDYFDRYPCRRMESTDSIYSVAENNHIRVFYKHKIISITDNWMTDTIDLNYYMAGSSAYTTLYESPDTIIRRYRAYSFINCKGFPNNKTAYIGIMKNVSGKEKLGWINLHISNSSQITIFETALQE